MTLALLFAIVGLAVYVFGDKLGAKTTEAAKLAYFAGLLAWLMAVGTKLLLHG